MSTTVHPSQILKAIYLLTHEQGVKATSRSVAALAGCSAAVVRQMVTAMQRKAVVKVVAYKGYTLTPKGIQLALRQVRCHRLWETFLHRQMGMGLYAVHQEALRLENHTSDVLLERMDQLLGFPLFDPHGHPIPSSKGVMPDISHTLPLALVGDGQSGIIARLGYQTEAFSAFCDKYGVNIGEELTVISKESSGGMNLTYQGEVIYATHDSVNQISIFKQDDGSVS